MFCIKISVYRKIKSDFQSKAIFEVQLYLDSERNQDPYYSMFTGRHLNLLPFEKDGILS